MKNLMVLVSGILSIATFVFGVLFLQSRSESKELARQLNQAATELSSTQALKSGLEQANQELQTQMAALRNRAIPEAPTAVPAAEEDTAASEESVVAENNAPSADTDEVKESREPTPEEIAAQEEEEKRRQEWQEERERRRAEFRERISNEIDMRKAFFAQIPTEGLAEEYQESHARLMEALDEVQAKMDVFGNSEMDRNERRAAMREMWQTGQEISGLMTMQRDVLLNDYAQQALGLNENQTQEFIEYMQTVDQMTTTDMMRGGRR